MPLDQILSARLGPDGIASDCSGMDFFAADHGLHDLLALYVPAEVRATPEPHWAQRDKLAGARLDELTRSADRHGRVLHARYGMEHFLSPRDPLMPEGVDWEKATTAAVLRERAATWDELAPLLAA